jgi:hypothetical protein
MLSARKKLEYQVAKKELKYCDVSKEEASPMLLSMQQ